MNLTKFHIKILSSSNDVKDLVIRRLNRKDILEVEDLIKETFPLPYTLGFLLDCVADKYFALLMEIVNGEEKKIIGLSVSTYVYPSYFSFKKEGYILLFGIRHDYRRKGYGTILLSAACNLMFKMFGFTYITLHVLTKQESANKFYQRNGFEFKQMVPEYYFFDNKFYNGNLLMLHRSNLIDVCENVNISETVYDFEEHNSFIQLMYDKYFSTSKSCSI